MPIDLSQLIESVRGLAGSGNVLGQSLKGMDRSLRTMEPGDLVQSNPARYTASPIAYDLWYLWYNANLMARYYPTAGADGAPFDGKHFDYTDYIEGNLGFLSYLPGLKTLKVFCDVKAQLANNTYFSVESMTIKTDWTNNGVNWINLMVFELWTPGNGAQFPSDGPKGFNINDYVGYFTFPIGQLGVMETISLIQETGLFGYSFHAVDGTEHYLDKSPVVLEDSQKPTVQGTPGMFPDAKDVNGNQLSGMNYCYGRHLIESAYVVPTVPTPSQNSNNSKGETAYAPTPKKDVELFSSPMKQYPEEVSPKLWMRYWIHKDSTLPVPGEFLGVLRRSG